MSVRLRLTLLYTGVLALTLTVFAAIVYLNMARALYRETDQGIYTMAQSVVKSIKINNSPFPLREVLLPNIDVFSSPGTYLQVVDAEGRLVSHSGNLGMQVLPLSENTLDLALKGKGFYETVGSGNHKLRIFNLPLILDNNLIGVLQVGRTLSQVSGVLSHLLIFILAGGLITVLVAGILGWSLARAAFRPVEKIIETASAIQKGSDLGRRIEYNAAEDELGMLVKTINGMLERLNTAYRRLEEVNESQRRFVADASHELRTPLTTIRGNAEYLLKINEKRPAGELEALKDIATEAERLTRLVSGLLALARADAGQPVETKLTDLCRLLEEVVRGTRLPAEDVDFIYQGCSENEKIWVNVNPDLIKQVLFILLDNAFKYTPAGGKVTLSLVGEAGGEAGEARRVAVRVSDSGQGIPEEELGKIFQRFYRGAQARGLSGSGLGLAIARWIVDYHGGKLDARSVVGEGSTFTVYLIRSS